MRFGRRAEVKCDEVFAAAKKRDIEIGFTTNFFPPGLGTIVR